MVTLHGRDKHVIWRRGTILMGVGYANLPRFLLAIIDYFNSCKYYSWFGGDRGVEIEIVTKPSFSIYLLSQGFSNVIKSYDVRWTQFIHAIILWINAQPLFSNSRCEPFPPLLLSALSPYLQFSDKSCWQLTSLCAVINHSWIRYFACNWITDSS